MKLDFKYEDIEKICEGQVNWLNQFFMLITSKIKEIEEDINKIKMVLI